MTTMVGDVPGDAETRRGEEDAAQEHDAGCIRRRMCGTVMVHRMDPTVFRVWFPPTMIPPDETADGTGQAHVKIPEIPL